MSDNNSLIINIDMDIDDEVSDYIRMEFEIFYSDGVRETPAYEFFSRNTRDFQGEYKINEITAHRNK